MVGPNESTEVAATLLTKEKAAAKAEAEQSGKHLLRVPRRYDSVAAVCGKESIAPGVLIRILPACGRLDDACSIFVCRPAWTEDTTPEELDLNERRAFLEWRRGLVTLQENEDLLLTPFEKNLEVWRQLWRVIERRYGNEAWLLCFLFCIMQRAYGGR